MRILAPWDNFGQFPCFAQKVQRFSERLTEMGVDLFYRCLQSEKECLM
jgi:hypothetical protein